MKRGGLLTKLLDRPPGLFQLLPRQAGFQSVLARALLSVNDLLAAAQSQGDQKAAQTIQTYRRNR
jgi:hypothetical protein